MKEKEIRIENLDPTFLFTWKGKRTRDEQNYHSHDYLELAFMISGEGKYHIEGQMLDVKEGDLLILNPGVKHEAVLNHSGNNPTTEFFVGFSDIHIPGYEENYLPVPDGGHILHTSGELRQKILRICSAMEAENTAYHEGKYFMLKAYLMQLILLVIREESEPAQTPAGYVFESINKKYVVEQILSYLEENYTSKISLDQIAGNMYLSPFYISKIFKSETGDTPIRYLINIRLEKAMELLSQGEGTIQEVAAAVGYDDAYHFSKLFKKRYGISPSQAKKEAFK